MSKYFRVHAVRRSLASFVVLTLLCSTFAVSAPAAHALSATAERRSTRILTRGQFIVAAVKALRLPLPTDLPAQVHGVQVPTAELPAVTVAERRGALDVFGTSLNLTSGITRLQALQVVITLANVPVPIDSPSHYDDVTARSPEAGAVALAVKYRWLSPVGQSIFGLQSFLSAKESVPFLVAVSRTVRSSPPKETQKVTIEVPSDAQTAVSSKALLQQVWKELDQNFYYHDRLDEREAFYKAAEALVQSANDPYTIFMRPSSAKSFRSSIFDDRITGIGAQVEYRQTAAGEKVLTVVTPLRGSPAEKAGLRPDDIILSVDGDVLAGLSFDDAVSKVRGPKGSTAKLRVRRGDSEMDIHVTRDTISIPEVELNRQGTVLVIHLLQFGKITFDQFRSSVEEAQKKMPVSGVVLDLRNNPGGLLDAAERVMSAFVPKGTVYATVHSRNGDVEKEETQDDPILPSTMPVMVLINKGSASASEIVAGALKDLKRATVIGEKSYGKGTVQSILDFSDGSSLKVTRAEWRRPNGQNIDSHGVKDAGGVEPDVVIVDGTGPQKDASLRKALELLR